MWGKPFYKIKASIIIFLQMGIFSGAGAIGEVDDQQPLLRDPHTSRASHGVSLYIVSRHLRRPIPRAGFTACMALPPREPSPRGP